MGDDFESASKEKRRSMAGEWVAFLGATRKYWLVPLIVVLLVLTAIVILGSTAAGPFIYTLF